VGHQPERVAGILAPVLEERGFETRVCDSVEVLTRLDLRAFDLIVPVWSLGVSHPNAVAALVEGVEGGTGLAVYHGAISWFTENDYAYTVGGHFVRHPEVGAYTVRVADPDHAITAGLADFEVTSEQYYLHVDPGNHVLTTTRFGDLPMPNSWVRRRGAGRIFYCALAHTPEAIREAPVLELLMRGAEWAAR
jgi:hypothetical protein